MALSISADTTLEWPLEAASGVNVVARIIDITPSTSGLSVYMPDATLTAPGQVVTFYNVGANTVTIKSYTGTTLLSIAAGLTYTLYLTGVATSTGTWRSFQAGASTAQAQASALAGYGLIAQSTVLSQSQQVYTFSNNYAAGAADRSTTYVWTGGLGTLTMPAAATVGNNWFMAVRNAGTGNLTIAVPGVETINGATSLTLRPGDSATINTDGAVFYTVGLGQNPVFAFDYTSINLAGLSGTYTLSGAELNRISYDFVGALAGNIEIIVPATTQQYWVANDTTGGAYTLTIGTATQVSPVTVNRGARGIYYCNGSSVVNADTASISTPIAIADGGTGATTAAAARIALGGTTVGIAVFIAATAAAGRLAITAAASGANSDITSLTGLTTPLTVPQGGTGAATFTAHGVMVGNGAGALAVTSAGTAGYVLTSNGAGADPTFQAPATSGTVTSVSGSGGTTGLTLTGGPITASGTLTLGGTLAVANGGTGITAFGTGVATALGQNVNGSGAIALTTSPVFVTPTLGVATATSVNKVAITAPATGATLTLTDGKTLAVTNTLTFSGTDATAMTFPPASASVGYLNIPQNSKSAAYTTVAADSGKHIFHPSTDANARTFTIDSNANVPYDVGTAITFVNMSANNVTIAITSDTLYLAGTGATGSRTLAQYGMATALKMTATTWIISGSGLS